MNNQNTISLSEFHLRLIRADLPFVSYRLPGQDTPVTHFGPEKFRQFGSLQELLENKHGFAIAPFRENGPFYWLDKQQSVTGFEVGSGYAPGYAAPLREWPLPEGESAGKEKYLSILRQAIHHIESGEAGKIVLSRWLLHHWPGAAGKAGEIFRELCSIHPSAFVYLFHIPGTGLWTGASPELLIESTGGRIQTVSLSGTRKKTGNPQPWGNKETNEHLWVSRYIEDQLELLGCEDIDVTPMQTAEAGTVEHLLTTFSASCPVPKLPSLVYALHPTPAVCGWPTSKAYDLIGRIENYDRSFYTGFIGPVEEPGEFRFYVNLRCMNILRDHCVVYVGGGITIDSDPEKEWLETELKSRTMLGAIEKIANFGG